MPLERPLKQELVLASASPRRQKLLTLFGLPFVIKLVPVDEFPQPGEEPDETARRLATAKALAVAQAVSGTTVIGADTMVVSDGRVLGKPKDEAEARKMLRQLRGRPHEVVSGVAIARLNEGLIRATTAETTVFMRNYTEEEINAYITSGDPFDKAGAYAIQHSEFSPVDHIKGSYSNVVGLPLCQLYDLLRQASFPLSGLNCESLEEQCLEMYPYPGGRRSK